MYHSKIENYEELGLNFEDLVFVDLECINSNYY